MSINYFYVTKIKKLTLLLSLIGTVTMTESTMAESDKALAQGATNPLTTTITVPIQVEYNDNIGPDDDGTRTTVFVQPIIPFKLNKDWNLITRTIFPIIEQKDIFPGAGTQSGLGDITATLFFSPTQPTESSWTQGAGPVIQINTATDDYLGLDEHGLGLSYIALKTDDSQLYGFLVNQLYSVEGHLGDTYSNLFIQPFYDYTTEGLVTFELTSESNYNWNEEEWSVPITFTASQFMTIGDLPILVGGGVKYWVESTDTDPEGLSLNLNLYLLFPK